MKRLIFILLILSLFSINFINADLTDGLVAYWNQDGITGASEIEDQVTGSYPITTTAGLSENSTSYVINQSVTAGGAQNSFVADAAALEPANNITICSWFKPVLGIKSHILGRNRDGSNLVFGVRVRNNDVPEVMVYTSSGVTVTGTAITSSDWNFLCGVYNNTDVSVFQNGVQTGQATQTGNIDYATAPSDNWDFGAWDYGAGYDWLAQGEIDETGFWNRSLMASEIVELYNSGDGLAYPFAGAPSSTAESVTLVAPSDNSLISINGANFTIYFNITGTNSENYTWRNVTYNVWESDSTVFNQSTRDLSQVENTALTYFIDDFTLGDYLWDGYACYGNNTFVNCTWSDNGNFSLTIGATLNFQNFTNYVYETEYSNFSADISILSGATLYDQKLWYNGTSYEGSKVSKSGSDYILYNAMDIPLITGYDSTNRSFYWEITFEKQDGTFFFQNLTTLEQNVSNISMFHCAAGSNRALNFTAWEEVSPDTMVESFDFLGTFNYWLGSGSVYDNFSITDTNINESYYCISPIDKKFYSDAQIQHEKTGYIKRSYYLVNASLSNSTNHIKLFFLNESSSTSFIIDVIDENQIAVPGVLINMQRYYPGKGYFETIEMGITDSQGSTIGHFEAETEDYKIIISQDGEILFESGVQKVFCRDTPCTLTFQIGTTPTALWQDFGDIPGLVWSLAFNESTNIWTYTYVDTTGLANQGRLLVYFDNMSVGKSTICNTTSASTAATLTCNVSAYSGTIYASSYITKSGEEILVYLDQVVLGGAKSVIGIRGLFWAGIILLILGCAGLWNPAVGIILVCVGVIILPIIHIASFGATAIWGTIFVALILLWGLKT